MYMHENIYQAVNRKDTGITVNQIYTDLENEIATKMPLLWNICPGWGVMIERMGLLTLKLYS